MVRSRALALLAAGLLVALSCSPPPLAIDSGWQIIVDCATFSSPQEAAQAEAQIDWSSNDLDRMNACTEGFAAQELHTYLGRLSGLEPSDSAFAVICLAENLPPHAIVLTDLSQPANHPAVCGSNCRTKTARVFDCSGKLCDFSPSRPTVYRRPRPCWHSLWSLPFPRNAGCALVCTGRRW